MYDHHGKCRSFKARCIESDSRWKNLNPKGYGVKGLVLADGPARALLESGNPEGDRWEIVFCEGEADWLGAVSSRRAVPNPNVAVFGIFSGGWTVDHAMRVGRGHNLVFLTDRDEAGQEYRRRILKTFLEAYG